MSMYFVTGNKNKLKEVQAILGEDVLQLAVDLPEIQELDPYKIIQAKLEAALQHAPGEIIVEDTSLSFDCLKGLPGTFIKWFLQSLGNKGLYELVDKYKNYTAEARTIVGYAKNREEIHFFEGMLQGTIVAPSGATSFGWDPIFQPLSHSQSFADMGSEEKNKISHRKQALEKLKIFLNKE